MLPRAHQLLGLSPKLPCYGLVGRPSNSAMNNLPGTFSLRNHFSSSPLFRRRSRSQAPPEVRYFFRRNHFSSFLPAEIGCPETRADRIAGNHCTFFEGTTFPPSFRPRLAQQEATTL